MSQPVARFNLYLVEGTAYTERLLLTDGDAGILDLDDVTSFAWELSQGGAVVATASTTINDAAAGDAQWTLSSGLVDTLSGTGTWRLTALIGSDSVLIAHGGWAWYDSGAGAGVDPPPGSRAVRVPYIVQAAAGGGSGDVTAAAVMTDNTLIKGDGGAKGVQDTGITVDDSNNVSGVGTLTTSGAVNGRDVAADGAKLDDIEADANNYTHPDHTGDVTSTGDGATTITAGAVSNAKLATMTEATIKGRASGAGTGSPTDLTATQARAILNVEDGADVTDFANVSAALAAAAADIAVNSQKITSLGTPTANTDAATKGYVDGRTPITTSASVDTIVVLTQAAYDAIGTPDATTLYLITA